MKSKKGSGSDREKDQGRIDTPVGELSEKDTIMHYNAVLLEELKSKMDFVIEFMQASVSELNRKIDALNYKVDMMAIEFDKKLQALEERLTRRFDVKLDALEERLTARIDKIAVRLDDHEGRIATVESYH
ncbi:MAG: hypothetical protein WC956_06385 [bacterium]